MIDSVSRTRKNYYPQVFLEECKYVVKEKKILKYIVDDIEISSDSETENFDEENSDKKSLMKKILMNNIKKILMVSTSNRMILSTTDNNLTSGK